MATVMTTALDLEAEIRDLAARRDINAAVQRYMRGLDRLDADLQRSAFHADAVIDCGLMKGGVDEFVTFAQDLLAGMDATHHLLGQVQIDLNGDVGQGDYACRDGEWRISARTLVTDWVKDDPGSLDFFEANPSAPRGTRGGADLSQTRTSSPQDKI